MGIVDVNLIKRDGTGMPFLSDFKITKDFGSVAQLIVENISTSDATGVRVDFENKSNTALSAAALNLKTTTSGDAWFRMWRNGSIVAYFAIRAGGGTQFATEGSENLIIGGLGHSGTNGNRINFTAGLGIESVTQEYWFVRNDANTRRIQFHTVDGSFRLSTSGVPIVLFDPTSQNNGTFTTGIKIGNNTDSAATAGAGSIRWTGSAFEGSNGSAWSALGGGASLTKYSTTSAVVEGSWNGNQNYTKTFTLTGAAVGDIVKVTVTSGVYDACISALTSLQLNAWVSSTNNVTVWGRVGSFITIPASSNWIVEIIK